MKNIVIPQKVRKVSKLEKKTLSERTVKLMEEAGELAAEVLRYQNLKGAKGKKKAEILYDLHLEAVDTLLMAMDILTYTGATTKRINKIANIQLAKWKEGTK